MSEKYIVNKPGDKQCRLEEEITKANFRGDEQGSSSSKKFSAVKVWHCLNDSGAFSLQQIPFCFFSPDTFSFPVSQSWTDHGSMLSPHEVHSKGSFFVVFCLLFRESLRFEKGMSFKLSTPPTKTSSSLLKLTLWFLSRF